MRKVVATTLLVGTLVAGGSGLALARTTKSILYHDGDIVRTVVNPSAIPNGGSDPFYSVTNGVGRERGDLQPGRHSLPPGLGRGRLRCRGKRRRDRRQDAGRGFPLPGPAVGKA